MGGLFSALGEQLAKRLTSSSGIGAKTLDFLGNKEWEFQATAEGKAVGAMNSEFHRIRTASLGEQTKHLDAIQKAYKENPAMRAREDLKTSPVSNFSKYAGTQHPLNIAIQELGKLNPEAIQHPLAKAAEVVKGKARLDGIAGSFGPEYENLVPLIASLKSHPDPRINLHGDRLLDTISNELTDTKPSFRKNEESEVKGKVFDAFQTYNKLQKKAGTNKTLPLPDTKATYEPPSQLEKKAGNLLRLVQIPFVAIPHVGQYFHIPADTPAIPIGKALLGMDKQAMKDTIQASGILAHTQWDVIHSDLLARTGKIAKWTNMPTAASILQKTIHQPAFNWMRLKQLSVAGSVGFHAAQYWAGNAVKGNKAAIAELVEMGIDPQAVIARGGQLSEGELTKGVYHYVNNRFFFDKSMDNAMMQNKNVWLRSAYMYHSFVNSEATYISRTLRKFYASGNIKGIAQYAATLGVVFPAVAPMLKSLEVLARTGSPTLAANGMQKDYKGLTGQGEAGEFASTYLDMLSHIGAMGAYHNYYSAIKANRLANAVIGPMQGMLLTDATDAVNAMRGKSYNPLGRDLTQLIPVAGKLLSHKLFPTLKEEKELNPKPTRNHMKHSLHSLRLKKRRK